MRKGSHQSEKAKEKIRIGNIGNTNALGCARTEETKKKLHEIMMGNTNALGNHHTEETKRKISESMTGEKHWMYGKCHTGKTKKKMSKAMMGNKNPRYGKHDTEEMKKKRRKPMIGNTHALGHHWPEATKKKKSEAMMGKNNPNYIDGKGNEPYPLKFSDELKESIRQRDGHICQKCGIPQNGRKLDVHHIDHDTRNCFSFNLISLCTNCNAKVNFNRKFWKRYFENKLKKKGSMENDSSIAYSPCYIVKKDILGI